MRRLIKFLHEIGTVGMMGALAAQLILVFRSRAMPPAPYAALRMSIETLTQWLLLPSLTLVLLSGLIAIAVHPPYHNAGWAWVKALLGVSVLEGTLGGVQGPARQAAELSAKVLTGEADPVAMADVVRHEWGGLWVILALAVANVALAIWRPRLSFTVK